jgi:hypothetical protein
MLKIGKINNEKLVNLFGSKKNIEYYNKNKKINNTTKETLLKRAYCQCEILELGNGEYEIKKIRENELPQSFYLLNRGLYKYLAPMILKKILYDYHQDNALTTTNFKYANTIGMINKNYTLIKKYKTSIVERYNFDKDNIYEYYKYVDSYIKYYIKSSLDLLKKCGVLKYDNPYMIIYRKIDDSHELSKIDINFNDKCRMASSSEVRYYTDAEELIKEKLGIKEDQEAYFSPKTPEFKKQLVNYLKENPFISSEGEEIIIMLMFKGYRIWYTTIEKCENLLNEFEDVDLSVIIENFNEEFIKLTLNNFDNRNSDVKQDKLRLDYEMLSRLTLDYFVDDIEVDESAKIKIIKNGENHFIEIITNEY